MIPSGPLPPAASSAPARPSPHGLRTGRDRASHSGLAAGARQPAAARVRRQEQADPQDRLAVRLAHLVRHTAPRPVCTPCCGCWRCTARVRPTTVLRPAERRLAARQPSRLGMADLHLLGQFIAALLLTVEQELDDSSVPQARRGASALTQCGTSGSTWTGHFLILSAVVFAVSSELPLARSTRQQEREAAGVGPPRRRRGPVLRACRWAARPVLTRWRRPPAQTPVVATGVPRVRRS